MVDDCEAARCAAPRCASRRHVERTAAREAAKQAVVAQILERLLTDGEELLDLFARRARILCIGDAHRRRAEDRDGTVRDEDIAVRRLVQAVHDVVRDALVEREERALIRLDADLEARHLRDLACPAAAGVHEDIAADLVLLAREVVAHLDAVDFIALAQDADDLRVRLEAAAVALRAVDVLPAHAKAVDRGIRHEVSGDDMLRETRLQMESFI